MTTEFATKLPAPKVQRTATFIGISISQPKVQRTATFITTIHKIQTKAYL